MITRYQNSRFPGPSESQTVELVLPFDPCHMSRTAPSNTLTDCDGAPGGGAAARGQEVHQLVDGRGLAVASHAGNAKAMEIRIAICKLR